VTGRFAPDAAIRRIDAEAAILAGGGRALLLQLAHPSVARGVAEHSGFEADPLRRLRATLEATYTIVFGTVAAGDEVAARVRAVHDRVVGPGYRADDPELLCWVNATLVDTAVTCHRLLAGPIPAADLDEYYEQSTVVAEVLGCPRAAQPADWAAFCRYRDEMVAGLEVGDTARDLAAAIFAPAVPAPLRPGVALARWLTAGTLPPRLRDAYGYRWRTSDRLAFEALAATTRRLMPVVPRPVRHLPQRVLTR